MSLPGRPQTEEEQDYEHQLAFVRKFVDDGKSTREILDLSRHLEELGGYDVHEETVKEILSYEGIKKDSIRKVGREVWNLGKGIVTWPIKSTYFPFTARRNLSEIRGNDGSENIMIVPWAIGNILVAGYSTGFSVDIHDFLPYIEHDFGSLS